MGCYDVLAWFQKILQLPVERQTDALAPGLAGIGNLCSIYIEFEHVVMRIDNHQLLLQVGCTHVNSSAHIKVGVLFSPFGAYPTEVG